MHASTRTLPQFVVLGFVASAFARPSLAQEIAPLAPIPAPLVAAREPVLVAATKALEQGLSDAARQAILDALWYDPDSLDVLDLALGSDALATDDAALLLLRRVAAGSDAKGGFTLGKAAEKQRTASLPHVQKLETARAAAIDELLTLAKKYGKANKELGAPLIARYLREVYLDLARGTSARDADAKTIFDEACAMRDGAHVPFVNALTKLMREAFANRKLDVALLAARSLHGLAVQAGLKDLKGPKAPDLSKARRDAAEILGKIRDLYAQTNEPLTVEQLEQMMEDDRIAFTLGHSVLSNPGVAVSPNGLYRLETICGHGTLLGAAETVEYHHRRLANWYGQDPFVGRPGIVRIVPEAADLEVEGAPYWWVGGFQSGDITVLRFNASDIGSLGAGLTHELTHRFDGAVYGGLPGWLAEGRAVWTADSYGPIEDEHFVPNKASFGTIENAMRKGYGDATKLEKLIEGTIEDYRDNYVAGYALWVYLKTWEEPEGKRVFEPRLEDYMKTLHGKKPLPAFTAAFCDGKNGRPKDFKAFAQGFATFISGFYWLDRKPFTERYQAGGGPEGRSPIDDAPTWQFSRHRAEPWFGQEQAAQAGELLAKNGYPLEAAHALVFGQLVDEFRTDRARLLADLLDKQREPLAAFVLRNRAWFRDRDRAPVAEGPLLTTALPKTKSFVGVAHAVADALAPSAPRAADALRGDAIRVAHWLGSAAQSESPPAFAATAPPFADVPHDLGRRGWIEDELTGYEEHRVPNLWFVGDEGDIHVGREKPRDATGTLDRNAGLHHAFTRSREWLTPGRARIRGHVQFTTTYVDGAIVFGFTRRDRNLRLSFNAGDYMYSIGQKESAGKMDAVHVSLAGSRDGEGAIAGRTTATTVKFDSPRDGFDFEILVEGSLATAFVDGKSVGSYAMADGQPIEGYTGFAASFGAYRVSLPTLSIEHRLHELGVADERTLGLTLAKDGPVKARELFQRKVRGVKVPENGAVLLWFPIPDPEESADGKIDPNEAAIDVAMGVRKVCETLWSFDFDPPVVAVLPRSLFEAGSETRKFVEADFKKAPEVRATILLHDKTMPLLNADDATNPTRLPQWMFVDGTGALRTMAPFYPFDAGAPPQDLKRWLDLLKARTPPPKDESGG